MIHVNLNKLFFIGLKQHPIVVGGVLLAIALTSCNASPTSQSLATNTPLTSSPSVVSSPPLLPTTPPQTIPSPPPPVSPTQNTVSTSRQQEAVQVIQDYYSAIARRDYAQAYSAWAGDGTASQQSFEQFRQGFANTESTAVEVGQPSRLEGAAGSSYVEIPVTVTAVATNGTLQRFRGSYVLRRVNDVPGSTPEQRRWHLQSAHLTQVN